MTIRIKLVEIITVLYIILFLYTGISKLMDYDIFKEQIANSSLLQPIAKLVAAGLPIVEFLVVLLLIIPRWRLKGLYLSMVLMTVFTIYILAILSFSKELPCSCGGILQQLSWTQHLIFNAFFIILALLAILLNNKLKDQDTSRIGSLADAT